MTNEPVIGSDPWKELLDCAQRLTMGWAGRQADASRSFPAEEIDELRATPLLDAVLPAELGGSNLGDELTPGATAALLAVFRTLGRADLSVGRLYEAHVNALKLLCTFARPELLEEVSRRQREKRLTLGIWDTGPSREPLRIERNGDRLRLDGAKLFASGAGHVDLAVVTGVLADAPEAGPQMVLVPTDLPGVAVDAAWWSPMGMRATASHRVEFTDVHLPVDALFGSPGDYRREPWLSVGFVRFAALHAGGAKAVADEGVSLLATMSRLDSAVQRARFAEVRWLCEAADNWLRGAATAIEEGMAAFAPRPAADDERLKDVAHAVVRYAFMTRLAVEEATLRVMALVEQAVGAHAFVQPQPLERLHRDLTVFLRQPARDRMLDVLGAAALASN